jgi:hypothetical protein
MATLTKGKTFTNGELVTPAKIHELVDAASVTEIVNADISASAAIADTKLAQIATPGKVANSATTATNTSTANAIVARDGSGNFSAGTITANLSGNASTATTAASCSGNAATATTAASCSGNAATATTAASCSGNAATATTLQTARTINGVSFNGSANITVTATPDEHTHDDRYYTETEMNTLLDGKQAAGSYAPATGIAPSAITGTAVITTDSRLSDARTPTDGSVTNAKVSDTAAIALSKLATGALPTGITIASGNIVNGTIVDGDISASAVIAGTKVSPNFGAQNIVTTGQCKAKDGTTASPSFSFANNAGFYTGTFQPTWISGAPLRHIGLVDPVLGDVMRVFEDGSVGFRNGVTPRDPVALDAENGENHLGIGILSGVQLNISNDYDGGGLILRRTSNGRVSSFYRSGNNNSVGGISVTTTGATFNTSSDYRLKQNIEPMTGGLDKLAELKPSVFEFISEPGVRVDGFIAHELQSVVPLAVTGTKDESDADGKPIYQAVDFARVVPLLVAAVQELAAKVAALEARLA